MKRISFNRTRLLRAIRAACIVLFLASAASARAQVVATPDGNGNVTLSGTGNYSYNGTAPTLDTNGTLTVANGANIVNRTNQGYIISLSNGATVTNNGTLTFGTTSASGQLGYDLVSVTDNAGNPITITNSASGILTDAALGSNSGRVVVALGHGAVTVHNNGGTITGSSYYGGAGISATSTLANVLVTNAGLINDSTTGPTGDSSAESYGIYANSQAPAGSVMVNNTGTTTGSSLYDVGAGIYAITGSIAGAGPITIFNAGTAGGSTYGIQTRGGTGNTTITNSGNGTTTGIVSGGADGILATTTGGAVSMTNIGGQILGGTGAGVSIQVGSAGTVTLTNTSNGIISGGSAGVDASSDSGLISFTNDPGAMITSNSAGNTVAVQATTNLGGAISIANNGTITAQSGNIGGTGSGSAYGIHGSNSISGGYATVSNGGSISSTTQLGDSRGILIQLQSGLVQINNNVNGTIVVSSTLGTSRGVFSSTNTGATTIGNSGSITASSEEDAFGIYAQGGGNIGIVNDSTGIISATNTDADAAQNAVGIYAANDQNAVTILNLGSISATGAHGLVAGIQTQSNGNVGVFNEDAGIITSTASSYANAAGVLIQSALDDTTVSNYHIISSQSAMGTSRGIDVEVGDTISVNNFGGGTITSNSSGSGTASGIYVASTSTTLGTTVTNNGTITVGAASGDSFGISTQAEGTGLVTITNANNIMSTSSGYRATGIQANLNGEGTLSIANNAGTITASGYYQAFGIYAFGGGNVFVSNSGTITASSSATYSGGPSTLGYGIFVNNVFSDGAVSVTNTGTVTGSSAYSDASGIFVKTGNGMGSISIMNSGSVIGTTTGSGTGSGIYAESGIGNITISNSGSGTVSGTGTTSAYGIQGYTDGAGNSSIVNTSTGLVSASSSSTGHDSVSGIYAESNSGSAYLKNTGHVTASGGIASSLSGYAATGVVIINSGALSATSASGYAAAGILATNTTSGTLSVSNTGTITSSGSYSYGMHLFGDNGSPVAVTNSGSISADGDNTGSGIYADTTGGAINISNSGALTISSSGTSSGLYAHVETTAANIVMGNTGTIFSTSSGSYSYGLYAKSVGNVAITNGGTISDSSTNSGSAYAIGIYGSAGGTLTEGNTAAITVISSAEELSWAIYGTATGAATVTNSATLSVTVPNGGAIVIQVGSTNGLATVTNSAGITASAGGATTGILVNQNAAAITNSGQISAHSGSGAYGIFTNTTNDSTVDNLATGTISVTSDSGSAYGVDANSTAAGIQLTNAASITATGNVNAYGIKALAVADSTLQNSGAVTASGSAAYGIFFLNQTGSMTATNTGVVQATASGVDKIAAAELILGSLVNSTNRAALTATSTSGSAYAYEVQGGQTVSTNSGTLVATGSVAAFGTLSFGYSINSTTNTGSITATSSAGYAFGIHAQADANAVSLSNSGTIISQGATTATGIYVRSLTSNATVANTGNVTVTGGEDTTGLFAEALGLFAPTSTGNVSVNNSGHVVATTTSGLNTARGIYTAAALGDTTITNSGYAGGFNTGEGIGYGINVDPTGPIIVNNTGTAIGTTTGIFLQNTGTVNNSGLASGGLYSIYVPTGSTVNLNDASPVQGLLKGGSDDTSTSLLNFNLKVRGNVAAARTELDAAIAQYNSALAAAPKGPGNDVDSEVVTINNIAYQWEDFFGIADNLIQGRLYAQTAGYHGIGATIDNFDTGNALGAAILAALDNLPDSAVSGALAQLSPQSLQVLRHIAFDGASFTAANVNNHLANLRDGLTGFDTSGFTVNSPGVDPTLTQMKSRLLAFNPAPIDHGLLSDSSSSLFGGVDMKDANAMVNTQPVDRWSAFISGNVVLANVDNTSSNIGDADYTTGSVMAGVDYRLTDHVTVGALFNYAHTSANLDGNGSKATVDSYAPGIYASYVDKKGWYGNAMLMYGFNNNTDDRNITIPGIEGVNHGASDGGQVTANMTGGYEFQRGPFKFGPVASLQYVHLTVGSFQEQGPTSLSIDRQEADSLRTQLGFEVRYSAQVPTCCGPLELTPHFQASWQHEYMDNSDGISSQFNAGAGGGSFVVQGQQPERDSAFLDLGLDAQVAKNVTLFIDYQTQAGQNDFFAQSAQGGVRIGF